MSPTVSVIVPHCNRPELVEHALRSIRQQSVPATEILLVDDGSTPQNREHLQKFASMATLLTTPERLGPSAARNFGARQATSEWIAFLDDDDLYLPEKLERQLAYLREHPEVQALGGGLTRIAPDGQQEYWGGKPTRRLALADALRHTASMSQSLIIRRDLFLAIGGFDSRLRFMEDYELGIRLLSAGVEMHFLGEPLFLYHHGGGRDQLTRNWRRMFGAELRIIHKYAGQARRAFGIFGEVRLVAAACKDWGLRRGRILGRLTWLLGLVLETIFGRVSAAGG